jgi:NAD(P)-dependent dehydrogenase (short-subunit alcohol dehydrogenase family)
MDGLRAFDGAVAIVTGAASGIGQALSEELAQRGSQVVLADLDLADAEAVAGQIRQRGGHASARHLDVSRYGDFQALVQETAARLGRIDYVFNNAGIGVGGELADYTMEAWDRILGVNLRGVIHGCQAVYPLMLRQGFGHIVNTASMAGLATSVGMISYATTKHAVVALSRALRAEAHGRGVRVSVLCPGVIRTPLLRGGRHGIFLGALPEEVARARFAEFFERLRPMPAAVFAAKALDQVKRNTEIIIIPAWWRLVWWMERVSPGLASFLARRGFERTRAMLGGAEGPRRAAAS